jgi:hypothetical protein
MATSLGVVSWQLSVVSSEALKAEPECMKLKNHHC